MRGGENGDRWYGDLDDLVGAKSFGNRCAALHQHITEYLISVLPRLFDSDDFVMSMVGHIEADRVFNLGFDRKIIAIAFVFGNAICGGIRAVRNRIRRTKGDRATSSHSREP